MEVGAYCWGISKGLFDLKFLFPEEIPVNLSVKPFLSLLTMWGSLFKAPCCQYAKAISVVLRIFLLPYEDNGFDEIIKVYDG